MPADRGGGGVAGAVAAPEPAPAPNGDVERTGDGIGLKDGVSKDRMVSVHDPQMRHGHKSSSKRFDGHKAAIVVDTDFQLITAVEVLPGNAPDNLGAWNWWNGVKPTPVCRWRSCWATPPTGTAIPGRPSPTRTYPDCPSCRDAPTKPTSRKKTSLLTWNRGPAPVRRGRLPGISAPRNPDRPHGSNSPAARLPVRWSSLRGMPAAAPVRGRVIGIGANGATAPAEPASDPDRGRLYCSRPGPCSRAKPLPGAVDGGWWWWSTGWPG